MDGTAQTAKDKGNAAFKAGDYPTAIGHYTAAILADRDDYTFPLNRAAAYLKLGKNEDAERDCTTVLTLNAFNAKALFRRGQARVGMGRLDKARQDFAEALEREPTNESVKEELAKIVDQLAKQKPGPVSSSFPTPKRRRVPITIVQPNGVATVTSVPKQTGDASNSGSRNDTLKLVSSRSFKEPLIPRSLTPSPSTSTPLPSRSAPAAKSEQPQTFKEAKNARDSIRPARVGGGIFRVSGDNTLFASRGGSTEPTAPNHGPRPHATLSPSHISPKSLYDFSRVWDSLSTTEERWSLFSMIPPSSLPTFFKTSLEPAMLVSILELFLEMVRVEREGKRIREYLDNFGRVPRFETVILFLSREEKGIAREVWERLGVFKGELEKRWVSCM